MRRALRLPLTACVVLAAAPVLAQGDAAAPPGETRAAREQARLCERLNLAQGAAACRAALELGIGPARRAALRDQLARHLVALEDFEALADLLREGVQLAPQSALAWQRLGLVLLFGVRQPEEAASALASAVRLDPLDAEAHLGLAQALAVVGRGTDAAAALDEALRLDPRVLDGRPAARALVEAARRGAAWP